MFEMTPELLAMCLAWFVVFLLSLTVHEASHAFAALKLGDPTAYEGGQVTLNPIPHMRREPTGTILVPLASFFLMGGTWMIGWASAPYDPHWADRHPRRAALMAVAGPVSNLLLVVVAALGLRLGLAVGWFKPLDWDTVGFTQIVAGGGPGFEGAATLVSILFCLNLLLFAFNLLPFPPLDGAAVLPLFLPSRFARTYLDFMRQPMWSLIGILAAWKIIGFFFWPFFFVALLLLYWGL